MHVHVAGPGVALPGAGQQQGVGGGAAPGDHLDGGGVLPEDRRKSEADSNLGT